MLNIRSLSFSYGKKAVLNNLSLSVKRGEIVALMGESGCGKSTLLNLIAGLYKPTDGTIECHAKKISYAFQEPRLFPWLTVSQNLAAVLPKDKANDARICEVLKKVGLADAGELYPEELSGGMKSRASLARALLYGGDLFLFDEPFAALNEELRTELSKLLRAELKARNATAIVVTHQLSDARLLADRVLTLQVRKPTQPS